ncbi:MAG: type I DNA topoisomerase [Alphaproteobacteria bacterium]|nr:type I DNA topoisomerase [Alphaproteobacteria bacterium]
MNLLIVESPSKAKTIEKYLGKEWRVIASIGHVRDLVPETGSVDTSNDFEMRWQIMPGKEKQLKLIIDELKKADAIYLASDPDREGEAIAWHINNILTERNVLGKKPVYRVAFHEITKNAVMEAIKHPREIDTDLVDAYIVRRALDYLIGFSVSPLLWKRNLGKSAGRVQSVAVKIVVDREKEIEAFKPVEYWSIDAECDYNKVKFKANLSKVNGKKIEKLTIENKSMVDDILKEVSTPTTGIVSQIDKKKTQRHAAAPFTTSTLQQEAARKLYFSSKRTMATAQKLYEKGFITYMRTDATNLSEEAIKEIREYISQEYGKNFIPSKPNVYITKSKNAQEAHEAIRPTHFLENKPDLSDDEAKLYDLIWKRTIACQMCNAEFDSVAVDIDVKKLTFHCVGTTRIFDGFMKVYIEDIDDENEDGEIKLPELNIKDSINIKSLISEQHFTQPPARYTEASLVKKLEELGIGRPSTYATIMSTIVDRKYVEQDKQHRFHPTTGGWIITAYLSKYFSDFVDVNFTAKTEDTLDDVSNGKKDKLSALQNFWKPTEKMIDSAKGVKTTEIIDWINKFMNDHIFIKTPNICPKCGEKLGIKLSKYGAFIGCSDYPKCNFTVKIDEFINNTNNLSEDKTPVQLNEKITFYPTGKFGPYISDGENNISAKGYTPETITLEIAEELLSKKTKKSEGILLGKNPETDKAIYYYSEGRYGPYISSNRVNVSVKEQPSLSEAIDLITNKKNSKFKFKKRYK